VKDGYTSDHLQRSASYASVFGEWLGLSEAELTIIRYGALLHDVGKIGVEESILQKDGSLTDGEYRAMQQHTIIGERILQPLHFAMDIAPIVRHHHERWDGLGYPDGLAGTAIPFGARVVAIVDGFDAMTTQRTYNHPMSCADALAQLQIGAGSAWDPDIVEAFVAWHQSQYGSDVHERALLAALEVGQ
jgi:putative two-component system response regulator